MERALRALDQRAERFSVSRPHGGDDFRIVHLSYDRGLQPKGKTVRESLSMATTFVADFPGSSARHSSRRASRPARHTTRLRYRLL